MGTFHPPRWKPPSTLYYLLQHHYCKIWVSRLNNLQLMQQYPIQIHNNTDLKNFQDMFVFRLQQLYFPNTLYFIIDGEEYMCSMVKIGSILIQRIPYRLCQLQNIPYTYAISILFRSFTAYNVLFQSYNLFKIQSTMIGFDRFSHLKVWHHTDLSSPLPQDSYCHSMHQMLMSIINAIWFKTQPSPHLQSFPQYLLTNSIHLLTYTQALTSLTTYCHKHSLSPLTKYPNLDHYLRKNMLYSKSIENKYRFQLNKSAEGKTQWKYSFKNQKGGYRGDIGNSKGRNDSNIYFRNENNNDKVISKVNSLTPNHPSYSNYSHYHSPPSKTTAHSTKKSQPPNKINRQFTPYLPTKSIITFQKHVKPAIIINPKIGKQQQKSAINKLNPFTVSTNFSTLPPFYFNPISPPKPSSTTPHTQSSIISSDSLVYHV